MPVLYAVASILIGAPLGVLVLLVVERLER